MWEAYSQCWEPSEIDARTARKNSQKKDPRDSDEGSDDDSTDGEDSDIDLEKDQDSDNGEDYKLIIISRMIGMIFTLCFGFWLLFSNFALRD